MPEMPQIQALAERLDALLADRTLTGIEVLGFSGLKTVSPSPEKAHGLPLEEVGRRGKFLILAFRNGTRILVHLSQAGRIEVETPPKVTRPRGAVVRFRFDDSALLVKEFGKERKAAWWVLAPGDDGPLAALGPEVNDPAFAELILGGNDRRRVHNLLRDQHTVAGIGRGYADDSLHAARLSPYATLASLDRDERARLLDAVLGVTARGLDLERGREGGLPPKLGEHFAVHARHGTPCPVCGDLLRRVSYESYEVTYCPACQTNGKILADRRMSKLLR